MPIHLPMRKGTIELDWTQLSKQQLLILSLGLYTETVLGANERKMWTLKATDL